MMTNNGEQIKDKLLFTSIPAKPSHWIFDTLLAPVEYFPVR